MKFSMLAIAATVFSNGVSGFAVNQRFGVRSVSRIIASGMHRAVGSIVRDSTC